MEGSGGTAGRRVGVEGRMKGGRERSSGDCGGDTTRVGGGFASRREDRGIRHARIQKQRRATEDRGVGTCYRGIERGE